MKEKTIKKSSRGGGALLKKYGPDYFRKLVAKKNARDSKARKLLCQLEKKQKLAKMKKK